MQDGIYRFGGDRQCRAGHLEFRDRLVRGREANGVLYSGVLAAAAALQIVLSGTEAALAQKSGGILTVYNFDNPPSLSIHEELTYATLVPMMGVSNNLVMYKQDEPGTVCNPSCRISRRTGRGARTVRN